MKRKITKKKVCHRHTKKRHTKRKKSDNAINYKAELVNMMKKIDRSYKKLNQDLKKHAPYSTIEKDQNDLLILLGECNYMVREFHFLAGKKKRAA